MAQIHRTSGSTHYLLNGTKSINGKKLQSLHELRYLHDHYEEILAETELTAAMREDEIIFRLSSDEIRLNKQLHEGIIKRKQEVDRDIGEVKNKIEAARNPVSRTGYKLQYWIAVSQRNRRINRPFSKDVRELKNVQFYRKKRLENKQSVIRNECANVAGSYVFLKENQSFLIGAHGEEQVITHLSRLPDDYHIVNDVNLHFNRAIHWKKGDEYIRNCQIDHVVVGPTGIFLLETKNWKPSDIEIKSHELKHQVGRANYALWYVLKDSYRRTEVPGIRNAVISMNGTPSGRKLDRFIDVMIPHEICDYISRREVTLSEDDVKNVIEIITRRIAQ